jgi:hypothetical protein
LGWNEKIHTVQKLALSRVPGINKKFHLTQDSCPWAILEIFFSPEMFKLICNAANKQKEARGPSEAQICIYTLEYSLIKRNKKTKIFLIIIHMSML